MNSQSRIRRYTSFYAQGRKGESCGFTRSRRGRYRRSPREHCSDGQQWLKEDRMVAKPGTPRNSMLSVSVHRISASRCGMYSCRAYMSFHPPKVRERSESHLSVGRSTRPCPSLKQTHDCASRPVFVSSLCSSRFFQDSAYSPSRSARSCQVCSMRARRIKYEIRKSDGACRWQRVEEAHVGVVLRGMRGLEKEKGKGKMRLNAG